MKRFVLQWQSPSMPAPAFWYYDTFAAAERDANSFRRDVVWLLQPTRRTT